jgi:hypothetical protein
MVAVLAASARRALPHTRQPGLGPAGTSGLMSAEERPLRRLPLVEGTLKMNELRHAADAWPVQRVWNGGGWVDCGGVRGGRHSVAANSSHCNDATAPSIQCGRRQQHAHRRRAHCRAGCVLSHFLVLVRSNEASSKLEN